MHCLLITHSSLHGHLGGFHLLAIMNTAARNVGAQISLCDSAFSSLDIGPEVGIAGSCGSLIFAEPSHCFPQRLHQFTFPPAVHAMVSPHPCPHSSSSVLRVAMLKHVKCRALTREHEVLHRLAGRASPCQHETHARQPELH